MGKVILIKTDGTVTETEQDKSPSLEQLQEMVGGYIEVVPMFNDHRGEECVVYCDEEGKIKNKRYNQTATEWWNDCNTIGGDALVGDVVILVGDAQFLA